MPDLTSLITAAAERRFPPVDGGWTRVDPWRPGLYGVVAFTGHAAISAPPQVSDADIDAWGADGFGGASTPRFMNLLAGPDGWVDYLAVLLVAHGRGPAATPLVERPELAGHARAHLARALRDEVKVYGRPDDDSALVTLAHGVAGLHEMSYEIAREHRGGTGTTLAVDALGLLGPDEVVVASVAPGNAASLRALLRAGFEAIGSVQLYTRDAGPFA